MVTPHSGPLQVINRARRFHPSTCQTHANELYELLSDVSEAFVVNIIYGGSDWSVKSLLTLLYMWVEFGGIRTSMGFV